ncbi:hypothetical protein BFW88_25880 [Pseudomonas fluorescens]|uniref:DUF1090 family protein n=1 Tax=Pseudomonas lactucae TaxID=2813360 RepID=A0A9X0Y8N9_9PSED|nr:DUF1090 family protein [Pseudomonas lactucae]OPA83243.1 hypothetical protein BFW88_25880 [Pseudomonas fluorescens]MBN2975267.1 DUF1090 family protein [Pseudomonas lactucae]MBN2989365.1 DUF1090 family protein [Pseudomonas lactucae]OPB04117.1 hypothetical protein BFW92_25800 [Pseudomonas fluorescens]OPB15416.1 hypothetical protein BFW93_25830 [Pseudomonas fluorescens]
MRISTLAPAALLLSLFALPANAADLSALGGALTSQLGGGNSGDCQKQSADLQTKIDAAQASNDTLKVSAFTAAQEQVNKGCNKLAEAQAKADAKQQTQAAKTDKSEAVKALGGLFK